MKSTWLSYEVQEAAKALMKSRQRTMDLLFTTIYIYIFNQRRKLIYIYRQENGRFFPISQFSSVLDKGSSGRNGI